MKKQIFVWAVCLLGAIYSPVFAESDGGIVIPLEESIIYQPDDSHEGSHTPRPTNPTNFHAFLDDHTLSVMVDNYEVSQVVVTNLDSWSVTINKSFVATTTENLANAGYYMIEIYSNGEAVSGYFEVEE